MGRTKKADRLAAMRRAARTIKITMTITLPFDNEIQFFDACKGACAKLTELGQQALDDGDIDQFLDTRHEVMASNDDAEMIGYIKVER